MVNWRRWIRPGLVVTGMLALLAVFLRAGAIEADLVSRATQELALDGQGWASVAVSGRSVTIHGTAPSQEAQLAARASVRSVAGVGGVADASGLLPVVSPYVWSVRKAGPVVTFVGYVPSEGFRTSLLAAARRSLPEAEIHDQLQLARGAPVSFNAGTAFVLDRIGALSDGAVTITDGTLTVSGVAASRADFATARSRFREDVPPALALGPIDILPARADPFVWSADYDGDQLVLAGYVPNEMVDDLLVSTARQIMPGKTVLADLEVASGAPDGFADAAAFAISALDRLEAGTAVLTGLTLDISGRAKTVDDYEAIFASFRESVPRGLRLASSDIAPAVVGNYGWRGEKEGGRITLAGFVPTPQARQELAETAAEVFAGVELVDNTRIAAGEPRIDWIGAVKFAMGELARLESGSVVIAGRRLSVEGVAAGSDDYLAYLEAGEGALPAGLERDGNSVSPPRAAPFRFVAARSRDAITLEGHVPSKDDHEILVSEARKTFGGLRLVDNLAFASGAPENFVRAAALAVGAVGRLAGGRSELSDATMNITGAAYHPAAAGAVTDSLGESMPGGFDVAVSISVRQPVQPVEPLRCRDLLQNMLTVGRIEFEGGQSDVSEYSYGLLDRVAATIERCPDAEIEVGAHTDGDGSSRSNLRLSQERAASIVEFLVDAGIRRERLTAVGYGEERPIADNDTEAGKAANRRIEFVLSAETADDGEADAGDGAGAGRPDDVEDAGDRSETDEGGGN